MQCCLSGVVYCVDLCSILNQVVHNVGAIVQSRPLKRIESLLIRLVDQGRLLKQALLRGNGQPTQQIEPGKLAENSPNEAFKCGPMIRQL